MKFYYDDIIYGVDITYADYKEREYLKSHVIYSQPENRPKKSEYVKFARSPMKKHRKKVKKEDRLTIGKESL
jgi:hypothetical protein